MTNHDAMSIALKASSVFLLAAFFGGCGGREGKDGRQRLSDLVPIRVVVADVASINEDGVTALYRISGSAFLKVSVDSIVQQPGTADGGVILKNVPLPEIEERSIRFDRVEQLDADRSCFATVAAAGEIHHRLFAGVHDVIRDTAIDSDMIHEAQVATKQILEGFYAAQGKVLEGIEWKSEAANE